LTDCIGVPAEQNGKPKETNMARYRSTKHYIVDALYTLDCMNAMAQDEWQARGTGQEMAGSFRGVAEFDKKPGFRLQLNYGAGDGRALMVRRGYVAVRCTGEAHANHYIDHCGVCMGHVWHWACAKDHAELELMAAEKSDRRAAEKRRALQGALGRRRFI
jgi:hypothetical protein